jgi:hypothetical protein
MALRLVMQGCSADVQVQIAGERCGSTHADWKLQKSPRELAGCAFLTTFHDVFLVLDHSGRRSLPSFDAFSHANARADSGSDGREDNSQRAIGIGNRFIEGHRPRTCRLVGLRWKAARMPVEVPHSVTKSYIQLQAYLSSVPEEDIVCDICRKRRRVKCEGSAKLA